MHNKKEQICIMQGAGHMMGQLIFFLFWYKDAPKL